MPKTKLKHDCIWVAGLRFDGRWIVYCSCRESPIYDRRVSSECQRCDCYKSALAVTTLERNDER